jgi:hypothetical protein
VLVESVTYPSGHGLTQVLLNNKKGVSQLKQFVAVPEQVAHPLQSTQTPPTSVWSTLHVPQVRALVSDRGAKQAVQVVSVPEHSEHGAVQSAQVFTESS